MAGVSSLQQRISHWVRKQTSREPASHANRPDSVTDSVSASKEFDTPKSLLDGNMHSHTKGAVKRLQPSTIAPNVPKDPPARKTVCSSIYGHHTCPTHQKSKRRTSNR
jgi:hypothetical protein